MSYEAVDVLRALGSGHTTPSLQARRTESAPTSSSLLTAMRTESSAGDARARAALERRNMSARGHSNAVRAGQIAATALQRTLSSHRTSPSSQSPVSRATAPASPVSRRPSVDSRRGSIDSTYSRAAADVQQRSSGGLPPRDVFAHAEYHGRPSSRGSSRSGYGAYRIPSSGNTSPVIASRNGRKQRQEILAEMTSSSDDDSPSKKRSARQNTRDVLKSLDLHASDMGSSEGSPSPRDAVPRMTVDPRVNSSREMHFTTSSTDEDKRRQRAWENHASQTGRADKHEASPVRSLRQRYRRNGSKHHPPSIEKGDTAQVLDESGSSDNTALHESVLESAMSIVGELEKDGLDAGNVEHVQGYFSRSRIHSPSKRSTSSPPKSALTLTKQAVAPAVQNVLSAAFVNAKGSPPKRPGSAILSASRSPSKKSPQIIPGAREGHSGFMLQTVPAYRPSADPAQELGLPVYRVTGKYNLPREQRSWGFGKVAADECFDNYSWWWKNKAGKSRGDSRAHGVYVEEPHLLPETLSVSMTEAHKFGAESKFDRSKYRTHDRRKLGPKFDDYSPHLPKKSDLDKLPLEYRKMLLKNSRARPGIRKSYIDDLLKRGTAMRDKHKASTWGSVEAFFYHQSAVDGSDARVLDTHHYD